MRIAVNRCKYFEHRQRAAFCLTEYETTRKVHPNAASQPARAAEVLLQHIIGESESMKMRTLLSSLGMTTTLLIMTGCSSLQTNYNFDPGASFVGLHTYSFAAEPIPSGQGASNPIMNERIKMALTKALTAKGLTPATGTQPDFVVAFVAASKRITTTQYVGGWNYSSSFPMTFTEGTLVVDIVSGKTNKMIWRGSASDAVSPTMSPETA